MNANDESGTTIGASGEAEAMSFAAHTATLVEANERLVVGMMQAQAEAEATAESLREATRLAELDPLTGLPNRVLLLDRFVQAIATADRHDGKTALLFIDLDHFKALNDSLGHAAGDETLKRVAQSLLSLVRKADTVSRFGGDEFLVLLSEVSAAPGAALIAAKIIAAIAVAGRVSDDAPAVTASIGISVYPDDGDDAVTLIQFADAAMYRAKAFGGGYFLFHSAAAEANPAVRMRAQASSIRPFAAPGGPVRPAGGPNEAQLREANAELVIASLRGNDERERAEANLQMALEAMGMGSWEFDFATDRISGSSGLDRILGDGFSTAPESLAVFVERFVEADRASVARSFDAAWLTGALEFERRLRRTSDDSLRWLHFKGRTLFGPAGGRRLVGVVDDESDRRSVEAQLRQSQKMEAMGRLTGGIAHDFNNLLLVIGGNLELLERRVPTDDRTSRLLAAARRAVVSGGKLNQQLLAFARRQDLQMEVISVATLLPTFEELLQSAVGGTVVVTLVPNAEAWCCHGDPHQLEVAILNLAINARDAMPDGGALTVALENRAVASAPASLWSGTAGDYVAIQVSDTGSGMPADVRAHAFEPFFTTKESGKGTGLGLSQVYGFARQCGGFVSLEDRAGGGTVVTMHLPRSTADRVDEAPHEPLVLGPAGDGVVVLVVDDDAAVRAVTHAMLDELDYRVVEADSAEAALALLAAGAVVDLVLSADVMPVTSGVDLARAIRARHPSLPVLLTSGHTAEPATHEDAGGGWRVLGKPYTQAALAAALRALRDSRPESDPAPAEQSATA